MENDYLSCQEAQELLGVKAETLYAYVSRGIVRRIKKQGSKQSLYSRADIEKQLAKKGARRGHRKVGGAALLWGDPILETSVSYIDERGPSYRGRNYSQLIETDIGYEQVCELLWTAHLPVRPVVWELSGEVERLLAMKGSRTDSPSPHSSLQANLIRLLALQEGATLDGSLQLLRAAIISLASNMRLRSRSQPVAKILSTRFRILKGQEFFDKALITCAEHELNASTFAARVVASTGAHIGQCLIAGTAAHSGDKHGTASALVEDFLEEHDTNDKMRAAIKKMSSTKQSVPGFQHPLYPKGDPRARTLLDLAMEYNPTSQSLKRIQYLISLCEEELNLLPSLDLGLVALCQTMSAPKYSSAEIFLLGRIAGWGAHILEQRKSGLQLRPRAMYQES